MLADFPDDFRYVLGLHEIVAVGMADGFAQASGRTTMVNLHTAPGVGNGMGAIFNAQANKTPLLVTAGQQARSLMTVQANLTNRDAVRMPHPLVKWSYEPPRAEDVPHALARGAHLASLPPRGPVFVSIPMDDWAAEADPVATPHQLGRTVSGAAQPAPDAIRELGERLAARPAPVLVAGPDLDSRRGWDAAVALAERLRLPVWATPATGGGTARASRRTTRPSRGCCRRPWARSAETLAGHDLVLVAGSSVLPVLPQHPGAAAAGGRVARGDHQRSGRGGARADGRRAGGRPRAHARGAAGGARPVRARRPPPQRPAPEPPEESDPMSPSAAAATLADVFPDDGILVLEAPSSTLAMRNRLRHLAPGQLLLRRRRRARFRAGRGDRRPAGPARAARGVRARRGLGPVRDPGLLDRGGLRRPRDVPGPAQRGVRDPQVVRLDRVGHRRAGPRPAGPRRRGRGRRLRRRGAQRAARATSCTRRSATPSPPRRHRW